MASAAEASDVTSTAKTAEASAKPEHFIGVDLGGTKMEGICLADDGGVRAFDRFPTPNQDYQSVLTEIARLVTHLESQVGVEISIAGLATIGVATPGFLVPSDGLLRNSNLTVLNGHPIDQDLTALMGRPVRVANDANCFVLSEAADGAAARQAGEGLAKSDVVFGATLGTGIGGGFVIDGQVWAGANGSAGEWSHTTLPFLRPEDGAGGGCRCGRAACIESFLSGHGLAADHHRVTGETLSPVEIGNRAGIALHKTRTWIWRPREPQPSSRAGPTPGRFRI
jgi:fructokinase